MWIVVTTIEGDAICGTLANHPHHLLIQEISAIIESVASSCGNECATQRPTIISQAPFSISTLGIFPPLQRKSRENASLACVYQS